MSKYSQIAPKTIEALKQHLGSLYGHINEGDKVLDFGSSTGYFGKLLIDTKKCVVDGIEIDEADYREAAKVLRSVYKFDLDGPWPKELLAKQYDILLMGDIIEHLKYPEKLLLRAKKVLKPDGRVLISVPNIAHISARLELLGGEFNYEDTGLLDSTHLKYFTLRSLKKLAADTGYKILEVDYSLLDLSPTVIKKILAKEGLSPTEKYWQQIGRPEARAYQYKLVLRPLKANETVRQPRLSRKPVAEHDLLGNKVIALNKENEEIRHELIRLTKTVEEVTNSTTWKIVSFLKRPYFFLKRRG